LQETLERVYEEHRQGLYTLALSITRRAAEAEDAVQEAFARLWATQAHPGDAMVPYVFAAVRNAALDQVRRLARMARRVQNDPFGDRTDEASIYNGLPENPETSAIDAEQHRRVRQAVDELPQAEREVIVLKIYAGLTFDEMAQTLGEPLPTVASRYRRALEKLSRMVKGIAEPSHE
jgi:RNA polymerase sigma-70 factor (ECF subfamily)